MLIHIIFIILKKTPLILNNKSTFWTPLDNAAKIFPAIRSKENTTVIRLTANLKESVKISSLMRAVKRAELRFPYFKVSLHGGFFWYYLEQVNAPICIQHDQAVACKAFNRKTKNNLLVRILVHKNKISAEFSHILTDGYGLLIFVKTILIYYFQDKGLLHLNQIDSFYTSKADKEEFEDAYNRYFKENIPHVVKQPKAFHLPFLLKKKPRFELLYAILSILQIKEKAKEKGVTITDYLVSVYLLTLQDIYHEYQKNGIYSSSKIARIQVPVNIRNIYPTKSMRNFSLFVMPEIDFRLGKYTFDEIVKVVYHKMQLETEEKLISKIISRNVAGERNLIVRGIPIWLKSIILYYKYHSQGTNMYSGVLTNLGKVELPKPIRKQIDYFTISPPPPNKKLKINCGVIGYEDKLTLSFGNITNSNEFERRYLHFLAQQGIDIRITKNQN